MGDRTTPPTSDRIRIDTDRGLNGDKIAHPDMAAAPLGTDAESANAPPSKKERAMAAKQERFAPTRDAGQAPGGGALFGLKEALVILAFMLAIGALFTAPPH